MAILILSVFLTTLLSGVFGMGGGMILMGVLVLVLPVQMAMIIHGIIQAFSNGIRFLLLMRNTAWAVLPGYLLGCVFSASLFLLFTIETNKFIILFGLGMLPLLGMTLGNRINFDITKSFHATICGFTILSAQILAGASGPILDMFFVKSSLDRKQIESTKAFTQMLSHIFKLCFYVYLGTSQESRLFLNFDNMNILILVAISFIGTICGKQILLRMSEANFRSYSRALIIVISLIFITKSFFV